MGFFQAATMLELSTRLSVSENNTQEIIVKIIYFAASSLSIACFSNGLVLAIKIYRADYALN